MEKNMKKNKIYIYINLNHFAVHLELTQHCKSTIIQLKKKKERKSREDFMSFLNHRKSGKIWWMEEKGRPP